jgi:hypothetical protein
MAVGHPVQSILDERGLSGGSAELRVLAPRRLHSHTPDWSPASTPEPRLRHGPQPLEPLVLDAQDSFHDCLLKLCRILPFPPSKRSLSPARSPEEQAQTPGLRFVIQLLMNMITPQDKHRCRLHAVSYICKESWFGRDSNPVD